MTDFCLVSTELREPYPARQCRLVRRLRSELRDDLALVDLDPPLARHVYDTRDDVSQVILAARFEGASLFPVTAWPLAVYICSLKDQTEVRGTVIASTDLAILDWGIVQQSE